MTQTCIGDIWTKGSSSALRSIPGQWARLPRNCWHPPHHPDPATGMKLQRLVLKHTWPSRNS